MGRPGSPADDQRAGALGAGGGPAASFGPSRGEARKLRRTGGGRRAASGLLLVLVQAGRVSHVCAGKVRRAEWCAPDPGVTPGGDFSDKQSEAV